MGVLCYKVSANKNKSPLGCSSLANYLFNRTFPTHSNSLANYGSIDIQFDYNFEKPMYIPVADAHGLVDKKILSMVHNLFNIFVIHTLVGEDNKIEVDQQIDEITSKIT